MSFPHDAAPSGVPFSRIHRRIRAIRGSSGGTSSARSAT